MTFRNIFQPRVTCIAAAIACVSLHANTALAQNQERIELEEIVVTAEKRAEGLQNIPIAITAVTGETLERAGVNEVGDLVQLAPSLQFGTRSTNVFIAMRGIGQAGQDIGSQSGVTVSLDNVPLLNHFMMNPAFLDIERVEVLRGPQGTIQGRNATGGAINIHSKPPMDEAGGEIALTAGNYNRRGVTGVLNLPVSEQLKTRLSVQSVRADGWMYNAFLERENDNTKMDQVRAQLLYQASDDLSVRALVEHTRDRGDPSFSLLLGRADPARPTITETPGYEFPQNDAENLVFYINEPNRRDVEDTRATIIATLELDDNAAITSTTGYINHDIDLMDLDVDLTPIVGSRFDLIGLYAEQFTQELTYTTGLGSNADLVAGVFYMHGEASEPLYLSTSTIQNFLTYLPAEDLDSYAAYAQLRYDFSDTLRATIGGRYTIDEKSYQMDATILTINTLLEAENRWKAFTPRFVLDYTPNDDMLIYGSVSRGFKSGGFNTLGDITQPVNTFDPEYVWNYELGIKAMLFDRKLRTGLTAFYADYENLQQTVFRINEETEVRFPKVENSSEAKIRGLEFEIEATPIAGLRVTGAVTRLTTEYGRFCNNDPLYPSLPTDPVCANLNLPSGAINLEGNALTQAPEWQYNVSSQYAFPVSETMEVTARADYKWQDTVYFDIYNNPINSEGAYGLLNASLSIGGMEQNWSLTAWVRNALDERYISQANTGPGANAYLAGSIGMPRMYGATLTYRF